MIKKNYRLDEEEKALLKDLESGKLKSLPNQKQELERIKSYLKAKQKNKRVNIRMTEQDFLFAQSKALEEGLPYQTLLSSILHKYFTGQLTEQKHKLKVLA